MSTQSPASPPINKLPNELLLCIFELCVPKMNHDTWHANHSLRTTLRQGAMPWRLTYICSRWRKLVIACSALWATLVFPKQGEYFSIEMAIVQLYRSSGHPLSFHMPYLIESVLIELCQQCRRWKYASLTSSGEDITIKDDVPSMAFPQLECFQFPDELVARYFPGMNKKNYPRLRSVALKQAKYLDVASTRLYKNDLLPEITHLAFMYSNRRSFVPIMQQCAKTLCSLELVDIPDSVSVSTRITLPQLRRISACNVPGQVIRSLVCPVLEEIVEFSVKQQAMLPWAELVRNSGPNSKLKSLTLRSLCITTAIEGLLKLTNDLTVLHITEPFYKGEEVEWLLNLLTDKAICLQLESFALIECWPHPRVLHRITAFAQLVRSRAETLRFAHLVVIHNYDVTFQRDAAPEVDVELYNSMVRDQLNALAQLRKEHPSLDLHVVRKYYGTEDVAPEPKVYYGESSFGKVLHQMKYRLGGRLHYHEPSQDTRPQLQEGTMEPVLVSQIL